MSESPATPWPLPGWTAVQPFPFSEIHKAFAGMTGTQGRIVLRYYRKPDGALAATAEFGPMSEGAPGLVHGGALLTVLDEALGAAAWLAGKPVMTARLSTEFRRGVPVGATLLVETALRSERHRLVLLEGRLLGADGALYAAAEGRFMILDAATQRRILGRSV